tara:strand:+ start:138 stop:362 length:225 start_codon:yes stop_codon:yes gene_type:complete
MKQIEQVIYISARIDDQFQTLQRAWKQVNDSNSHYGKEDTAFYRETCKTYETLLSARALLLKEIAAVKDGLIEN